MMSGPSRTDILRREGVSRPSAPATSAPSVNEAYVDEPGECPYVREVGDPLLTLADRRRPAPFEQAA